MKVLSFLFLFSLPRGGRISAVFLAGSCGNVAWALKVCTCAHFLFFCDFFLHQERILFCRSVEGPGKLAMHNRHGPTRNETLILSLLLIGLTLQQYELATFFISVGGVHLRTKPDLFLEDFQKDCFTGHLVSPEDIYHFGTQ